MTLEEVFDCTASACFNLHMYDMFDLDTVYTFFRDDSKANQKLGTFALRLGQKSGFVRLLSRCLALALFALGGSYFPPFAGPFHARKSPGLAPPLSAATLNCPRFGGSLLRRRGIDALLSLLPEM